VIYLQIFWWLLIGHALADYGIQSEYVATARSRKVVGWFYPLTAHALIHGGIVAVVTGSIGLGIAEFVAHWFIDFGKGEGAYGIHADQFLHILCKVLWVVILL
jgi:hypothetical protein